MKYKGVPVVSWHQLPTRMPLLGSVVLWLALDRLDAAGWVWGVVGTVVVVGWLFWALSLFIEKHVEIDVDRIAK